MNIKRYPKITFGMIVLNGEPFVIYNLRSLYQYAHQIIVVEGACEAAKSIASQDGHSTDGTLEAIKKFINEEDPDKKVILVTAEDEGKSNSFWSEKDEMSQAYAKRATGDWLWQVDYDEFYLEEDMESILKMLSENPSITVISFPYKQFWGGFDYLQTGEWFLYDHPCFDRLFRWEKGYQYTNHRPPTVVDENGRDLRSLNWISYREMQSKQIYLYHYSYVLPKQAEQKVGYYANVSWTKEFRDIKTWYQERYLALKDPYHIGEGMNYWVWLKPYHGNHPKQIINLQKDIALGNLELRLRPTDDIEALLKQKSYIFRCWYLHIFLSLTKGMLKHLKQPIRAIYRRLKRNKISLRLYFLREEIDFLNKKGWQYREIMGYKEIYGWLTDDQAIELFNLAKTLPDKKAIVVEIGSFLGKSSFILAEGLKNKCNPTLYCIDPFNADGGDSSRAGEQYYQPVLDSLYSEYSENKQHSNHPLLTKFIDNMKSYNVYHLIKPLVGYSQEFASNFAEEIDLLFIDGNHDYDAVLKDYLDWSPKVKIGGFIALHDVDFNPFEEPKVTDGCLGPGLVAQEKIINNYQWTAIRLIDNLLIAQKAH